MSGKQSVGVAVGTSQHTARTHTAHSTAQSAWCGRQHKSQPEDTLRSPVGRWMARRSQLTIFLHRSNNQKNPPTLFFSFLFAFLFVLTLTGLARFPSNIRSDISGPFILCSVSCDGYIARVNWTQPSMMDWPKLSRNFFFFFRENETKYKLLLLLLLWKVVFPERYLFWFISFFLLPLRFAGSTTRKSYRSLRKGKRATGHRHHGSLGNISGAAAAGRRCIYRNVGIGAHVDGRR